MKKVSHIKTERKSSAKLIDSISIQAATEEMTEFVMLENAEKTIAYFRQAVFLLRPLNIVRKKFRNHQTEFLITSVAHRSEILS